MIQGEVLIAGNGQKVWQKSFLSPSLSRLNLYTEGIFSYWNIVAFLEFKFLMK